MLQTETLADGRIRHFSDLNMFIKQIETDALYEDAVDIQPCPYTYEETDLPISLPDAEELLEIIVGGEAE